MSSANAVSRNNDLSYQACCALSVEALTLSPDVRGVSTSDELVTSADLFTKAFGRRVSEVRASRKVTQEELATRAGLHRTAISLIEQGKREARLTTIYKLSSALGVHPRQLMPDIRLRVFAEQRR